MIVGMNTTAPAHLIGQKWRSAYQMSFYEGEVRQFPWLKSLGTGSAFGVFKIINLPVGYQDRVLYIAVGQDGIYQLKDPTNVATKTKLLFSDGTSFSTAPLTFHPAITIYNNLVFVSWEDSDLLLTDGTRLIKPNGDVPRCRYLENFFDHVVSGWDRFKGDFAPYRVRWSGLYNYEEWIPSAENEADYFDLVEWQSLDDLTFGLTGMKRLGDQLICYLPSAIIKAQYIGLPKIMNFTPVEQGVGNTLPYMVTGHGDRHFFLDLVRQDFFMFDGRSLTSIGREVQRYLKDVILPLEYSLLQFSSSFVYPEKNQVWFGFPGGQHLVYNWVDKAWSECVIPGMLTTSLSCIGGLGRRSSTCDELTSDIDSFGVSADDLLLTGQQFPRLFGSTNGLIYREDDSDQTTTTLNPELITGDFYYDDLEKVKEVDGVCIHASYTAGNGVEVWLSARDHLDDTVTFVRQGTWNSSLPEGRLSFPRRVPGRIFRWKFLLRGTIPRGFTWRGFAESIYAEFAEE